jgi:beta-galactosidase
VWSLTLSRGGKTVFDDTKNIAVIPPPSVPGQAPAAGHVALFDPNGSVKDFFTKAGVAFSPVTDLTQIPDGTKVLVIGQDALDAVTSGSSQFAAWASQGDGRVVIALDQKNPLKFQALPGQMSTDTNHGCLGFPEELTSPVFAGLKASDCYCWGPDDYLYRDAYVKPVSGGKSLLQCDTQLQDTALVQMQAGPGLLLLSQLLIGEKLGTNPVAQQLLLNMVGYGDNYHLVYLPAVVDGASNPPLMKAIDAIGVKYTAASDPLAAIQNTGSIAVLDANPANLKTLASNLPKLQTFTQGGGWLVLNNLSPDGLADYNTLVGVNHIIRPFHMEKVTWPAERNPLTAGLSTGNIVLGTGKQIVNYQSGEWPVSDAYSYVVDLDEVAPFATSTFGSWDNITNNYTQNDGEWRFIINLPPVQAVVPISLARPEKILQFTWVSDLNYEGTTKIELTINGKAYDFDTQPNGDPQTFDIPDQPTTDKINLKVVDWQHDPTKTQTQQGKEMVGIDNIYIKVARPADFYQKVKPMLNIGAMVEYPQGKGGIILCNIKFQDTEQNPQNVGKKQAILSNLLHNLGAEFSGGKTIIAGGNLAFTPIDLSKQANQFRGQQGWFGDKNHTFEALPSGKQTMAGVTYDIYHFTTSVVPEAVMLGGGGGPPWNLPNQVTGIPVNCKADALFFLEAARINHPLSADDKTKQRKYDMADYVIHYADGQTAKVPINPGITVGNYQQSAPEALPGAQIAWRGAYQEPNSFAVAYSQQWNNPRPDVEISSVDLVYGSDMWLGVPVLLALTAATGQ